VCDFFKCLDHDQMVGARIYMSKFINLSKMLFSAVHFAPTLWMGKKYSKHLIFNF